MNRYETPNSKTTLPRDTFSGNQHQLLEAAAARVMGSTSFSAANLPNLYSQFGTILSHMSGPAASSASTSPGAGSINALKVSQLEQLHEPPPAHSSNTARSIHRTPQSSDIFYSRSTESLIPSNMTPMAIHSSLAFGKSVTSNQHQTSPPSSSIHRQTPVQHIQFSSQCDIEDLSSNQQQLYGSYANVPEAQQFSPTPIQQDIGYEAVSPAPAINDSHIQVVSSGGENGSFQIVHFPDLGNLTPEHAHQLAEKFSENDFRLKVEPSRVSQSIHQDNLLIQHQKMLKESSNPTGTAQRYVKCLFLKVYD